MKKLLLFISMGIITIIFVLGINGLTYSQSKIKQENINNNLVTKEENENQNNWETEIQTFSINNLKEADTKTRKIIQEIVNRDMYSEPNFSNLSCKMVNKIDQEWLLISNNKFGLSPQYKIWQSIIKVEKNPEKQVILLGNKLGWTRKKPLTEEEYISPDWLYSDELNYTVNAPLGHLPWVGIDAEIIRQMSVDAGPGCGSCTIDAIYLQNDRFYRYIPALYKRFAQCLKTK